MKECFDLPAAVKLKNGMKIVVEANLLDSHLPMPQHNIIVYVTDKGTLSFDNQNAVSAFRANVDYEKDSVLGKCSYSMFVVETHVI